MKTIKTIIHEYSFWLDYAKEKVAYEELCKKLTSMGLKCFESYGSGSHYDIRLDGREIELETIHLFSNQWNTAPIKEISETGLRVFDWAQDYFSTGQKKLKRGHWLEQTEEMRGIRKNTVKCGYCGHQEPISDKMFCDKCLDSEYLKSNELHLLRLLPIVDDWSKIYPLNEQENNYLLPLYKDAQLHGLTERGKSGLARQRERIEKEYDDAVKNAKTKRDGMLWLLDRGIKIDNCIYYTHSDKFCFGCRSPVDETFKKELLDILVEFPFEYEIK